MCIVTISCTADPLVHYGRHFAGTICAMCNIHTLLTNGILHEAKQAETLEKNFAAEYVSLILFYTHCLCSFFVREHCEHAIFKELIKTVPKLEE